MHEEGPNGRLMMSAWSPGSGRSSGVTSELRDNSSTGGRRGSPGEVSACHRPVTSVTAGVCLRQAR